MRQIFFCAWFEINSSGKICFGDLRNVVNFGAEHQKGSVCGCKCHLSNKIVKKGFTLKVKMRQNFNPFEYKRPIVRHIYHTLNDFLLLVEKKHTNLHAFMHDQHYFKPSCSSEKEEPWVGTFCNRNHYIRDEWLSPEEQYALQLC